MFGTTTATPSTQAILTYNYLYRSMTMTSTGGGNVPLHGRTQAAVRDGRGPGMQSPADLQAPPFLGDGNVVGLDHVELGNRRGLLPGADTILSILEEKVNARVEATFPAEKSEPATRPDYWSAEATGERIARFALKFYDRYAEKHGESEEALKDFLKYVTGAINEGFGQARREIANVSGGQEPENAKSLVNATYNKVMSVLEEFRQSVLDRLNGSQVSAGSGTGDGTEAGGSSAQAA